MRLSPNLVGPHIPQSATRWTGFHQSSGVSGGCPRARDTFTNGRIWSSATCRCHRRVLTATARGRDAPSARGYHEQPSLALLLREWLSFGQLSLPAGHGNWAAVRSEPHSRKNHSLQVLRIGLVVQVVTAAPLSDSQARARSPHRHEAGQDVSRRHSRCPIANLATHFHGIAG